MEQLARLKARLTTLTELGDIIVAMRALAAAALQESRKALPAVSRYALLIESGISDVAATLDATAEPVLPSENGEAGRSVSSAASTALSEISMPSCWLGSKSRKAASSSLSVAACKGRPRNVTFRSPRRCQ